MQHTTNEMNMKNFTLLLLTLFGYTFALAQTEQVLTAKIERVTVFLQGAQITRTAATSLKTGLTTLVFDQLSDALDPSTIQIEQTGDFTILSVNHRRNYGDTLAQSTEFQFLQDELLVIQDSVRYLKTLQNIIKEEEVFLKEGRPSNSIEKQFSAAVYENAATYYATKIRAIRLENLRIERQIRALNVAFQQKRKAINERLGEKKNYPSEVVVKVKSERATNAKLALTYLTPNASWTPTYDLKVETIVQPIDLMYKANLVQSTGEDWKEVLLTFSNADPSKSGVLPNLPTNYLNYSSPYASTTRTKTSIAVRPGSAGAIVGTITDDTGEPLIGATVLVKGAAIGTITDFDGRFELNLPEGATEVEVLYTGYSSKTIKVSELRKNANVKLEEGVALDEVVVVGYGAGRSSRYSKPKAKAQKPVLPSTVKQKQTTVEFTLDIPYTVPSNGEDYAIIIARGDMAAQYEYRAVPKIEEAAYLNAKIADWTNYNLMSGEINLYFENTYIGKSALDTSIPSDTLQISLGRDQNVQIQRTPIEEFRKRNFVGNKQIDERAYRISVRNGKAQPINIQIADQIPISRNKDIDVEQVEVSGGVLNEETGKVVWELQLAATAEVQKLIAYRVKYPKGRYVLVD
ncbi:MAG: mucoidy inhibitor MuiA family protein [Bacteroidota bacterium]